jgi:hypothetical protein
MSYLIGAFWRYNESKDYFTRGFKKKGGGRASKQRRTAHANHLPELN